jgi:hypothetical protein
MIQWWYATDDERHGPVSFKEIVVLFRQGRIGLETLTWTKGMADWQPFGSLPTFANLNQRAGDADPTRPADNENSLNGSSPPAIEQGVKLKYGLAAIATVIVVVLWSMYQKNSSEQGAAREAAMQAQELILEQQKQIENAKKNELALEAERKRLVIAEQSAREEAAKHAEALKKKNDDSEIRNLENLSKNFLKNYYDTWSGSDVTAVGFINNAYGDNVEFYGTQVTKAEVIKQKIAFIQRWPVRSYGERVGATVINCNPTIKTCSVSGIVDWSAQSVPRNVKTSGDASFELLLDLSGSTIKITREAGKTGPQNVQNTPVVSAPQTLTYPHGTYWGEVLNGKAHGRGTYTARSGTIYTGQFIANEFSGDGTMTWTNGSKYNGKWRNDEGISGTMVYPNGSSASGIVKNSVFAQVQSQVNTGSSTGDGGEKLLAAPGRPGWSVDATSGCRAWNSAPRENERVSWVGSCVDGVISGQGTLTWSWQGGSQVTKAVYSQGRQVALGYVETTTIENGDTTSYKGFIVQGVYEGKGIRRYKDGAFYDGDWKAGVFNGTGTITFPSKASYEGGWLNGKREGFGVHTYSDRKTRYQGNWSNNVPDGLGTIVYADGNRAVGYARQGCVWAKQDGSGNLLLFWGKTENQCQTEKK